MQRGEAKALVYRYGQGERDARQPTSISYGTIMHVITCPPVPETVKLILTYYCTYYVEGQNIGDVSLHTNVLDPPHDPSSP
jgi:hypothetical protein